MSGPGRLPSPVVTWDAAGVLGGLGPDPLVVLACGLAVAVGALVQGLLGFGLALLSVPVLAWLAPQTVPVGILLAVMPLVLVAMLRERAHLDWRGIGWGLVGRLPGGVAGAVAVALLPVRGLQLLVAATVGLAVLAAVVSDRRRAAVVLPPGVPLRIRRRTLAAAGALSGLGGTTSGIGGPPMAVAFRHSGGPVIRSTLAAFFAIGALLSLGSLALVGEVTPASMTAGLALVPFVAVGYLLSGPLRSRVRPGAVRVAVLVVSGVSAAGLLVEALVG